ncbi:MAG: hypothetical protein ACI8XB_000324 [Patiriisocius sp.]|jgi:hypothetical protein
MKKSYLFLIGLIAVGAYFATTNVSEKTYTPRADLKIEAEANGAAEHYKLLRANPETGEIDRDIEIKVRKAMAKRPSNRENKNDQYEWIVQGPDNIGGRTRALHVYKDDPNQILAGGVTGGLWKSNNNGATWNRLEGLNSFIGVSSVTRLGNGTIYVGSGNSPEFESGSNTGSGTLGHGLFKSTDEGETFTAIFEPSGIDFSTGVWETVDEVAASPVNDDVVWVAYGGGLATYNDVTEEFDDKISSKVQDFDISDDGLGIIAVNNSIIRVSQDGGDNFSSVMGSSDGDIPTSGSGRKVVAISPTDRNYMYATTTSSGALKGVFGSINGGEYFTEIAGECNGNPLSFCPFGSNTQGWYDNCLTVVPSQPGSIILGGIEMHRWNISPGSTETNINGGWDQINNNFDMPNDDSYVHSDIQTFEWDSDGIFYIGCDGGVFRSTDQTITGYWSRNYNYITSQFYGIAFSGEGAIFGGMQDNGTTAIAGDGGSTNLQGFEVNGGDGFDVESSQEELVIFVGSQYNSLGIVFYNLEGGGSGGPIGLKDGTSGQGMAPFYSCFKYYENFNELNAPESIQYIVPTGGIEEGDEINYVSTSFSRALTTNALTDANAGDTLMLQDFVQTLYAYGDNGAVCLTRNVVNNTLNPATDWADYNISGAPICFEYTPDGNSLFIGTTSGRIYRISGLTGAYTPDQLNALDIVQIYSGGAVVTDISIDVENNDRLLASRGTYAAIDHVVYTDNALSATGNDDFTSIWNIDGDLVRMPVYSVTFDMESENILAGTEYGVWVTTDMGDTEWEECNTNDLYRVPVYDLKQQTVQGKVNTGNIYAGTHGGGIFSAGEFNLVGVEEIAAGVENADGSLIIYPNPTAEFARLNITLENTSEVNIEMFDLFGKKAAAFNQGKLQQGANNIEFNVSDLSTGTYIVTVNVDGKVFKAGKVIVSK